MDPSRSSSLVYHVKYCQILLLKAENVRTDSSEISA